VAIKGKGKTRTRRMVSAPPRPQMVARKRPFLMRRSTWIVAGIVVLAAAGWGIWHVWSNHQASQQLAKERAALLAFRAQVDKALPPDHTTPGGTQPDAVFSTLAADLAKAGKGQMTPAQMRTEGAKVESDAKKAADAMAAIKTTSLIDGDFTAGPTTVMKTPGLTQLMANDAQLSMADALRIYQSIGGLLQAAADVPAGAKRAAILTHATDLASTASSRFNTGYQQLLSLETTVGDVVAGPITAPGGGLSGG